MKGSADSTGSPSAEAREIRLTRYEDGRPIGERDDVLAAEEPLEIRVEGRPLAVVMRTPGHDRELAAGFLLTEGVIKSMKDVFDITSCVAPGATGEGNAVDVALTHPDSFDFEKLTRHVFTSSSCGICSNASIDAVMKRRKPLHDDLRVKASVLLALPQRLARKQETFKSTGGLHACALFDATGKLLALREDVVTLSGVTIYPFSTEEEFKRAFLALKLPDQAERDAWRESAESALAGFGAAIESRFNAWGLTPAESEVALNLLKGRSHKEIAYGTQRSERTVRQHAVAVYQKSGLRGRAELAAFFLDDVMLPPRSDGSNGSG